MTDPNPAYILRDLRVGDIGQIVRRQGELYAHEYGWDISFEALVAEIAGGFVQKMDRSCERFWVAERQGQIAGSVFVMRENAEVAKLRILYVEPFARGLGIGKRLVDECIAFSCSCGYHRLTLWTNDPLVAARRLYEAAGFVLVREEPHHSFGKDMMGQFWELAL